MPASTTICNPCIRTRRITFIEENRDADTRNPPANHPGGTAEDAAAAAVIIGVVVVHTLPPRSQPIDCTGVSPDEGLPLFAPSTPSFAEGCWTGALCFDSLSGAVCPRLQPVRAPALAAEKLKAPLSRRAHGLLRQRGTQVSETKNRRCTLALRHFVFLFKKMPSQYHSCPSALQTLEVLVIAMN